MGKFSGAASVRAAQEGKGADLTLPTGEPQQAPPAPSEGVQGATPEVGLSALREAPPELAPEEGVETIDASLLEDVERQGEESRQAVPSIFDRAQNPTQTRWKPRATAPLSLKTDGGLKMRADNMAKAATEEGIGIVLSTIGTSAHKSFKEGVRGPELASEIAEKRPGKGDIFAAISRADALETIEINGRQTTVPNPLYSRIASAVVENEFANLAFGKADTEFDPVEEATSTQDPDIKISPKVPDKGQAVTHAAGNAHIGQQIHLEYQRAAGNPNPTKLESRQEAETLGAAFKHLWAEQNGGDGPESLVRRGRDPKTGQTIYQLTALGEQAIKAGDGDRKRLFPNNKVKPAKQPLVAGKLPGDVGKNVAKRFSGAVGKQKFGEAIEVAMHNLGTVPNVVDKQRAKILLSTVLPVFRGGPGGISHNSWQAEINNIGESKLLKFKAAEKADSTGEYDAIQNLADLMDTLADDVQAIVQERHGANYLSYNVQGFQGRISPQQGGFNPTRSKAVRFVTRNATPSIANPGSRVEKNLRQMYAMMLVGDTHNLPALRDDVSGKFIKADALLPAQRDIALNAAAPQLEKWGDRLNAALEMTDEQYEAVAEAISQGMSLLDPNFPQFGGLNLDPTADADLIKAISDKGEDGPHYIDGLIDFANYSKAKRAGKPYASYFNAYMDGKTNGIASNGVQMGHIPTAERTGVVRTSPIQLLDEGDIRDELAKQASLSIHQGWIGSTDNFESELNDVAYKVFNDRELNKAVTMTFGYGKEMDSFAENIDATIGHLIEKEGDDGTLKASMEVLKEALPDVPDFKPGSKIAKKLMEKYGQAVRDVMSPEAIESRLLMRTAADVHSAMNLPFIIRNPVGMDLIMARQETLGYDQDKTTPYKLRGEGEQVSKNFEVAHYDSEITSAAIKRRTDASGAITEDAGGHAYGGSVVAPVQSFDAGTVALTSTGASWDKLKAKSGGNPYLHTIYDAFKVDANGYDTVLEEVNKNWLDINMKWSYLRASHDAVKAARETFKANMRTRDKDALVTRNESLYMNQFLATDKNSQGKLWFKTLFKRLHKLKEYEGKEIFKPLNRMESELKKVGWDINNPPKIPTVGQLEVFADVLYNELDPLTRLSNLANKTDRQKHELKKEILRRGYQLPNGEKIPLQYYAH